jgi:AhpD family alkylhydroperoxidase
MSTKSPKQTKPQHTADLPLPEKGEPAMTAADSFPKIEENAPPKPASKPKRTLTRDNFFKTVADVVASGPVLFEAAFRPRISAALREKLFLAVSSVNDCRYCKWGHTHWAMAQGVPLDEVNQILGQQSESLAAKNPAEAAAILFAQHYAEELDQIDPDSIENLREHYSDAEVAEILAYVRFITLTNLTGNTVDAFLTGSCSQGKASSFESAVAAAAAPVALVLTQLAKFDSKIEMEDLQSETCSPGSPNTDIEKA